MVTQLKRASEGHMLKKRTNHKTRQGKDQPRMNATLIETTYLGARVLQYNSKTQEQARARI